MIWTEKNEGRDGLVYGISAYVFWGFLPLFFLAIHQLGNVEVLAWRLVSSFLLLIGVATIFRRWRAIAIALRTPRLLAALGASAGLILANWLTYLIATRSGHVLEASLGYFINPLVNVALGMLLLGERLRLYQLAAIALAAAGVLALAVHGGGALWISLLLAISFGGYGLIRKLIPVNPLEGLTVETILLAPIGLAFLLFGPLSPPSAYAPANIALLTALGPVTVLPLLLFAAAAKRMSYTALGLLQYICPTMQFVIALWLGEAFLPIHALAFGLIWAAILLYIVEGLWNRQRPVVECGPI